MPTENGEKLAFFATLLGPTFALYQRLSEAQLQAALDAYRAIQVHIESGEDFVKPALAVVKHRPRVPAWPVALANVGKMQADPPAVTVHVPTQE